MGAAAMGGAGCLRKNKVVAFYSKKTEIEVAGEKASWTLITDIDSSGWRFEPDVRVDVRLYDEKQNTVAEFSKVVNNVDKGSESEEYEITYIDTPEVINSVYDYSASLTIIGDD